MNSRQISACVGAGVLMLGLLVLVARRSAPTRDPNDTMVVDTQTARMMGGHHGGGAAGLTEVNSLSKQAGREATNLFKLPLRMPGSDTNAQLFQGNRAEEGEVQRLGDGFLPGPPPER
jgi:hypothetical protein